jgi:5'-phosphate synthase pdxT subunit
MARVGVLALQGGFRPHLEVLRKLGHGAVEIRNRSDLTGLDGLILPGGESTTQLLLIDRYGLGEGLDQLARGGTPILATCAGLILTARRVTRPAQRSMGWLDIAVERNAWGRQLDSFEGMTDAPVRWQPGEKDGLRLPLVFIRAPRITEVGAGVEVLATFESEPILVRQGSVVGASFHPELTGDPSVHLALFGGSQPSNRRIMTRGKIGQIRS